MPFLLLEGGPSTAYDDVEPEYPDPATEAASAEEPSIPQRRSLTHEHRAIVTDLPRFFAFRDTLRAFLQSPMGMTSQQRAELAQRIRSAPVTAHYIHEVLRQCTARRGGFGLDNGIDLLTELGTQVLPFARDFLRRDGMRWAQKQTIVHHDHDDFWHILLGSLARSGLPENDFIGLIEACGQAGHRGLRDAAVLALYELASPQAQIRLAQFVELDPDPFIRNSARELLEDLES
jgi:hypothetical protein